MGAETSYNSRALIIEQSHHEIRSENQSCTDRDVRSPITNKNVNNEIVSNKKDKKSTHADD